MRLTDLEEKLFDYIIDKGHSGDCSSLSGHECDCHLEAVIDLKGSLGEEIRSLDKGPWNKEFHERWKWL